MPGSNERTNGFECVAVIAKRGREMSGGGNGGEKNPREQKRKEVKQKRPELETEGFVID